MTLFKVVRAVLINIRTASSLGIDHTLARNYYPYANYASQDQQAIGCDASQSVKWINLLSATIGPVQYLAQITNGRSTHEHRRRKRRLVISDSLCDILIPE
jgi:hypothetical protein